VSSTGDPTCEVDSLRGTTLSKSVTSADLGLFVKSELRRRRLLVSGEEPAIVDLGAVCEVAPKPISPADPML